MLAAGGGLLGSAKVMAVPSSSGGGNEAPSGNDSLSYCQQKAGPARNACDDDNFAGSGKDLITATTNVATYHCDDEVDRSEQRSCIDRKVKGFIDQAARRDSNTAASFKSALHTVLRDAGGSLKVPSPRSVLSPSQSSISGSNSSVDPAADPNADCENNKCDFIKKYVNPGIQLFSAAFGLIAVISIIMGGIQYTASAGDPQKVTAAKKRILNTIVAIVAYFFLYGFLQFLVPGGLFN